MLLASVLLSGTMLFSCTEEIENPIEGPEENPVENTELHEYTVTAFSEDSGTKAELGTDNYIFWQEGDKINLISTDDAKNNYCFTLSDGAGTAEGVFTGAVENPGADYVGIYPYNEKNAFSGSSGTVVWGKYDQCAIDGGFDPEACLMAGMTDSEGNVRFKNLCSYIKFTTDFDCKSIVLTCMDKAQCFVSPKIIFSLDENGTPDDNIIPIHYGDNIFDEPLPTVSTLTLVGKDGGIIPAGTYYVAVLPTTYDGISFTFTTKFDKTLVKATKTNSSNPDEYVPITISRNVIANVGSFLIDDLLPSGSNDFYGSGTESDPYLIHSLDDLKTLESIFSQKDVPSKYAGAHYLQTKDINCERNFISIGRMRTNSDYDAPEYFAFNGTYDGGGYKIYDYKLKPLYKAGYYAGLFNCVSIATIKNLNVQPAVGEGNVILDKESLTESIAAGALIGYSGVCNDLRGDVPKVVVYNCHLVGSQYVIESDKDVIFGGLIGLTRGNLDMRRCSNEADLGGRGVIGGLIGSYEGTLNVNSGSNELLIDRCRNNGDITCDDNYKACYAGGLLGAVLHTPVNDDGLDDFVFKISNSVNSGTIYAYGIGDENKLDGITYEGGAACAGGFFGYLVDMHATSYFHNCLNKGAVQAYCSTGTGRAGGFIGYSEPENYVCNHSSYKDHIYAALCVNVGNIEAKSHAAAFCGTYLGLECFSCLWLDENTCTEVSADKSTNASIPYNAGLNPVVDPRLDDYFCSTIDKSVVMRRFSVMTGYDDYYKMYCRYYSPKQDENFLLLWGSYDEWVQWAVAWTGSATWGEQNPNLDLDFNSLIDVPIAEN